MLQTKKIVKKSQTLTSVSSNHLSSKLKKTVKSLFRPQIRSKHPSHSPLRDKGALPLLPFKSVVRLGSTTDLDDTVTNGGSRIECNTIQAVKNSGSKLLMKRCFTQAGVKTADWWIYNNGSFITYNNQSSFSINNLPYPIVAKSHFGSRGEGNYLLKNQQELQSWMTGKTLSNYIFEKYYDYNREYRLHVTKNGCFYTCRKLLKSDTPEDKRWFRNDSNSTWAVETNPSFDKPINWDIIVVDCVKALKSIGADVAAFDVKVQSAKTKKGQVRDNPEYIIIESNTAPSFGDITLQKYKEIIPIILKNKHLSNQ